MRTLWYFTLIFIKVSKYRLSASHEKVIYFFFEQHIQSKTFYLLKNILLYGIQEIFFHSRGEIWIKEIVKKHFAYIKVAGKIALNKLVMNFDYVMFYSLIKLAEQVAMVVHLLQILSWKKKTNW